MRAQLKNWQLVEGRWEQVVVEEQTCVVKSKGDCAVACEFVAKTGGIYTIYATVSDDDHRKNESELTVWVPGGASAPSSKISKEKVEVIPD